MYGNSLLEHWLQHLCRVAIAALLSCSYFDFIERGAASRALPKYMELRYAAFRSKYLDSGVVIY